MENITKSHKIYILLQQQKGTVANLYKLLTGSIYNHAAIGIDPSFSEFYSFRTKWGFTIEHPFDFKKEYKEAIQCAVYEIEVDEHDYALIQASINKFKHNPSVFHYSYLSLSLGLLRIKHTLKHGYFCSRFVAEVLSSTKSVSLPMDASIYLPSDFLHESFTLSFKGKASDFKAFCTKKQAVYAV